MPDVFIPPACCFHCRQPGEFTYIHVVGNFVVRIIENTMLTAWRDTVKTTSQDHLKTVLCPEMTLSILYRLVVLMSRFPYLNTHFNEKYYVRGGNVVFIDRRSFYSGGHYLGIFFCIS